MAKTRKLHVDIKIRDCENYSTTEVASAEFAVELPASIDAIVASFRAQVIGAGLVADALAKPIAPPVAEPLPSAFTEAAAEGGSLSF